MTTTATPPGAPPPAPPDPGTPAPPPADGDTEKAELKRQLAGFQKTERERQQAEADKQKADKDKADKDAIARGEHETVIRTEKAARETAEAKAKSLELRLALVTALGSEKLADGALGRVVEVLAGSGLKLGSDGTVEGLEEKLKKLRETEAFFFAPAEDGAGTPPATGLPGTRPKSAPTGDVVKEVIRQNQERAKPENNRLIQLKRKGA